MKPHDYEAVEKAVEWADRLSEIGLGWDELSVGEQNMCVLAAEVRRLRDSRRQDDGEASKLAEAERAANLEKAMRYAILLYTTSMTKQSTARMMATALESALQKESAGRQKEGG